jgi:hypothetical protein
MDIPTAPNEKFWKNSEKILLSENEDHYRLFLNEDSTMVLRLLKLLQSMENIVQLSFTGQVAFSVRYTSLEQFDETVHILTVTVVSGPSTT